jgi:L-serine dehydratase
MDTPPPSIFNDVIGPVMRGPSSSHCAAALRIGRIARDLMGGRIDSVLVRYDSAGSLAHTHRSQGSDMGLCAGLLGWDATDERMVDSETALVAAGVALRIEVVDLADPHPNTYRLELVGGGERHELVAISTGGGMIQVIELDGARVAMHGDCHYALIFLENGHAAAAELAGYLRQAAGAHEVLVHVAPSGLFVEARGRQPLAKAAASAVRAGFPVRSVRQIAPVLPVLAGAATEVPFRTAAEMLAYNEPKGLKAWELAVRYEMARGDLAEAGVVSLMAGLVRVMAGSVAAGLRGTEYADRILGAQAARYEANAAAGRLLDAGMLNRMIAYVTAVMEAKSALQVVVAAPTAGSCGGLPGACLGAVDAMGLGEDAAVRAMLAAGLVGVFIAGQATFAAELAGCQAECGAGSAMAAAALVELAGGSAEQAVGAAAMALQNLLGMVCDPVANRVEVPCLGKNVLAAANALACANMALSGFDVVVPLDEVIQAMAEVGRCLPASLRCTGLGGLSVTPAARAAERRLAARSRTTADR